MAKKLEIMMKILVVEDDYMIRMLNEKSLELMEHKVVASATNGADAIKAAKKYKPDVILMDIRLTGNLDGIDTMHEISKFSNVPVIYLTIHSDEINRARAAKTNMLAFCVKPIHFDELKMLLAKVKIKGARK